MVGLELNFQYLECKNNFGDAVWVMNNGWELRRNASVIDDSMLFITLLQYDGQLVLKNTLPCGK